MKDQFERTKLVIGEDGIEILKQSSVIVFGIGGVGSYVCEGLARSGIGHITIVDKDTIDITNINRQIPALHSTVGKTKVNVMKERIRDINPKCDVCAMEIFYMPENRNVIDFAKYDYVVDAIDTVTAKLCIIEEAKTSDTPIISSMGTGNKLDPGGFIITDIENTRVCPLAKVMRKELRKRKISNVKVIYSEEEPKGRGGSVSFVPSVAGLMIAAEVVKDLIG